jgi:hypothetical protein
MHLVSATAATSRIAVRHISFSLNEILIIAETTKSLKGRLSNLRDEIQKQGFDIYSDEERGDFTFIEAREL